MDAAEKNRLALAMQEWAAHVLMQPGPFPSPCVSVCQMTEGVCGGCWRTIDEIAAWGQLRDSERRAVWVRIAERLAQLPKSRP